MSGIAKDLHRLIRRIGRLTDGQASVCDLDLEVGQVDSFRVEIRPNDGYYADGVFTFRIHIPSDYERNDPPKVFCETDIYHPNIDTREPDNAAGSSNVCLNLLGSGTWDRKFGLDGAVFGLVYLLHHPNLSDPLVSDISRDRETFEENIGKYMRGQDVDGRKFNAAFLKANDVKPEGKDRASGAKSESAAADRKDEESLLKALEQLGVTEDTVLEDETYEDFIADVQAQITELERSESVESIDSAGSGVVFDERGNDKGSYHYVRDNSYDSTVCGD